MIAKSEDFDKSKFSGSKTVIFTDLHDRSADPISWDNMGTVVAELSEVYRIVRERRIDLILTDERRHEMTAAVAGKLRRTNGLIEIWTITDHESSGDVPDFLDGRIVRDL